MSPLFLLVAVLVAAIVARTLFTRVVILEYERGVRYKDGAAVETLGPGVHWMRSSSTVTRVDVRPTFVPVPGQEVVTADGVGVKLSLIAKYQVTEPVRALNSVASYREALYTVLQLALREVAAAGSVDAILATRLEIGKQLVGIAGPKVTEYGLTLLEAEVKDVMFPGDLKKIFAQVVKARQEGLAALERARGESAALRNLANAAGLVEQRPALMQLRVLQALGQTPGNTVVLGLGGPPQTIPLRQDATPRPEVPPPAEPGDRD
ncbi:MAG TPA: slipin family protein [Gemmatimonadales bacterium]|jgi:regulator of protease activity HflC (stomatin/prohibitin superfamily)